MGGLVPQGIKYLIKKSINPFCQLPIHQHKRQMTMTVLMITEKQMGMHLASVVSHSLK